MKLRLTLAMAGLGVLGIVIACSSSSSSASGACATLNDCCVSSGNLSSCVAIASEGNEEACTLEVSTFCVGGGSGSGTTQTGCAALVACCNTMTGAAKTNCSNVASEGTASTCNQALSEYESAGACGSTGPGSGSGSGNGCTKLAACCTDMTGAAASACNAIVSAGVVATCSAELSVYESAGSCTTTTSGSGSGSHPGSGSGGGSSCAELAACCPSLTGESAAVCNQAVQAGVASGCAATFNQVCEGTTSGSGSGSGSHPGSGTGSGSGSGSDAGVVDCSPHALPENFQFRTPALTGGMCSSTQDEGFNTCLTNGTSCSAYETGTCTACVMSDYSNSTWGALINVTASGAGAVTIPFFNTGGCISKIDPAAGTSCAIALEESFQCELEACLAYCPVASASDTAGYDALVGTSTTAGCLSNADSSVCSAYSNEVNTACSALFADASTAAGTECENLEGGQSIGPYLAAFCGGEDAGVSP